MYLILGTPEEEHVDYVCQALAARGERATIFDAQRFPYEVRLSFNEGNPLAGFYHDLVDGNRFPLSDIRGVYWKMLEWPVPRDITDYWVYQMAQREFRSAIGTVFRSLDCVWLNPVEAIERHQYKGHQLQLLKKAGLRVPRTLVSSDIDEVRAFYERENGQLIFKPVAGGAHTVKLSDPDFTPERAAELANAPVQFQEYVPGVDIRVYVFPGEVFSAEIHSGTLDFRDNPHAEVVPIEIPAEVAEGCHTVVDVLGYRYSGVDIRRTPDGEYIFFEGNPCPMFCGFQNRTGYPVGDRLVKLLLHG